MNGMVERRLRKAILAVGSIWFTAWVDAGQPDLLKLRSILPSEDLLNEQKELNQSKHSKSHLERSCD